jgi:hypothetical protein
MAVVGRLLEPSTTMGAFLAVIQNILPLRSFLLNDTVI